MSDIKYISFFGAIFASYLAGSIPTGYIVGRLMKGIDIRNFGSGNMGATNVVRVLGKGPGILTLVIDMIKGLVAVLWIARLFNNDSGFSQSNFQLGCGIAAIGGHNWTCFLRFKGGKGVATSTGVFLGLAPYVTLCLVGLWCVSAYLTRYVSLSSIIASTALPIFLWVFDKPIAWVAAGFLLSLISIWKHRSNIKRLLDGKENKIGQKSEISDDV